MGGFEVAALLSSPTIAERHGCAGALRVGGVGGHFGAPHEERHMRNSHRSDWNSAG